MEQWNINKSRNTYNISKWSDGYFDINEQGHIIVYPTRRNTEHSIDLYELTQHIKQSKISFPILVRFLDILHDRVARLTNAFNQSMKDSNYRGNITVVYPIKVNQQYCVLKEILSHSQNQVGLEAGSKAELMAVIALSNAKNSIIVCNGYKDSEYIRLALIGQLLGHKVFIVIEKRSELDLIIQEARTLNVKPLLGVRVRLASTGTGKWQNTGGEKSKFGLSAAQILTTIDHLKRCDLLDSLTLLHFHLGSQLPNIRDIQKGIKECARFYTELCRAGVPIDYVDVGGGLGVDYEGTHSRNFCSINYSIEEYAKNIVNTLKEVCAQAQIKHPNIITESGRAMTAHHAVLITNVIDTEQISETTLPLHATDNDPYIIKEMWNAFSSISECKQLRLSPLEAYHDVLHCISEVQSMFVHGMLSLEQRARAEQIYFATCQKIRLLLQPATRSHRDTLDELNEKLAHQYFCNMSIFQSMPDVWAIQQIFPIIPLHRHLEEPKLRGVLHDITCDSDGRIDQYVDSEGIEPSLQLHKLNGKNAYWLGFFLVGAYQETLGDAHNLFGNTNSVNVELTTNGQYKISSSVPGDTVESVLSNVGFNQQLLLSMYESKLSKISVDRIVRDNILKQLKSGLSGYTYLED